jgi:hypothetical protein
MHLADKVRFAIQAIVCVERHVNHLLGVRKNNTTTFVRYVTIRSSNSFFGRPMIPPFSKVDVYWGVIHEDPGIWR